MFVTVIKIKCLVQLGRLGRASIGVSIYCRDVTEGVLGAFALGCNHIFPLR